jgi:hypothetical protein
MGTAAMTFKVRLGLSGGVRGDAATPAQRVRAPAGAPVSLVLESIRTATFSLFAPSRVTNPVRTDLGSTYSHEAGRLAR